MATPPAAEGWDTTPDDETDGWQEDPEEVAARQRLSRLKATVRLTCARAWQA